MSSAGTNTRTPGRRIGEGLVWVAAFVLLAKGIGALKEIVVAARYGVDPAVDAYVLLYAVAAWPGAIALSVLTAALVPLDVRLRAEDPSALARFRAEVLGAMLALAIGILALLVLVLPLVAAAASPQVQAFAQSIVPPMAAMGGVALLVSLYSVWLVSHGRHLSSALEGVPALVLAIVVLLAPADGAFWLGAGTLMGALAHLGLAALVHGSDSKHALPAWRWSSPIWRQVAAGVGALLVGQVLASATAMIELWIATRIGPGTASTMAYANRVLGLFTGLVVLVLTRVMLPVFAQVQRQDGAAAHRLVMRWFGLAAIAGGLLSTLVAVAAPALVQLLFERGAFTSDDTNAVAAVLRVGALQLAVMSPAMVLTNFAIAQRRFGLMLATGAVLIVVVPISGWLLGQTYGAPGLAAAPTLGFGANLLLLLLVLRRRESRT